MIDVRGKRVLVVGLARSGRAAALCLRRHGAVVVVTDTKPPAAVAHLLPELLAQKIGLELGSQRLETFLAHDLVVVSPGVPWDLPQLQAARARGIPLVPEIEVAGWYLSDPIVGVTGSNGKTTTTALLGKMLEASGFPTFVGGNIGVPLSSAVDRVTTGSIIVAELSSFQLEAIQDFHPHVAVLLNISPNHLDRHPSFEAYAQAKRQIFRNQRAEDYAILNADDPWVCGLSPALASQKVFFSRSQQIPCGLFVSNGNVVYRMGHLERVLLKTREVRLRGGFNLEDVLAAAAAACVLGADFDAIGAAVREFKGVEHRLEYVREIHGVAFYNNSKATSVDATVKSLEAFDRGVHLILGGKDKGAPYAPLRPLLKDRVREVLLIGTAADRIAQELSGAVELVRPGDLESAVREAFQRARPGDVVLLAPACSSFDQFQDYEHRGRVFKEFVERLREEIEAGSVEWKWKPEVQARIEAPANLALPATPLQVSEASLQDASTEPYLKPLPRPVETPEDSHLAMETATDEAALVGEAAKQPEDDQVEDALQEVARADDRDSKRRVAADSATETRPHDLACAYEISAQEFPPADVELVSDASKEAETRQLLWSLTPDMTDDAQLPYEARANDKGVAAGAPASRDFAEDASKDESKATECRPTIADGREPESSAPDSARQLQLPGSCPDLLWPERGIGSQAISDLWNAGDERVWRDALSRYWSYIKPENLDIEKRMNRLDFEEIKRLDPGKWYGFLKDVYFPWKYTALNRLATTTKQLKKYEETNNLGELFSIKENLFAFDPTDIRQGLKIAKSIKGLGWAGSSGLLALLFPKWFGTADQFVVKALREIESLPERRELYAMRPESLREGDAVLLIQVMRRKAADLNALFGTDEWTPRKIDMILWASRG
jgi:UDP-N-acetylmuramoylalanine--D-glutamate ligase